VAITRSLTVALCAGAAGGVASAQPPQVVTGPVADYWVSAQTSTGFGIPGAGGPGGFSLEALMGAQGGAQHLLTLQLGSQRRASDPNADHLPPAGLQAGPALPLVTPRAEPNPRPEGEPRLPGEMERPNGRMLIFWGCGEHAPAGQPVVIDFAQLSAGRGGANPFGRGVEIQAMQPPSPSRSATYGEWPNARARTSVPPRGSLAGAHVVRGNYSPEIRFDLSGDQDFLAPLSLTTNAKTPGGSVSLAWNAVPRAQGYFAQAMGGDGTTMVLWSSSAVQVQSFALPDYIAPPELTRLLNMRVLLTPQTTTCAVPKEVADAAPQAMLQLAAYGPEANFSYPPRPENRATPWNIEWTAKVRYRSATGGMLGMTMDMPADEGDQPPREQRQPAQPAPAPRRPAVGDILRGLGLPRVR